jgi:hypothetical protein
MAAASLILTIALKKVGFRERHETEYAKIVFRVATKEKRLTIVLIELSSVNESSG